MGEHPSSADTMSGYSNVITEKGWRVGFISVLPDIHPAVATLISHRDHHPLGAHEAAAGSRAKGTSM